MAKKLSCEQIESYIEQLELNELLHVQKKIVGLISQQEKEAEGTIAEAEKKLQLIRTVGGKS